ncbi:hypothetical protein [Citrobacter freundii]|uniref:hypothetical protein n=1 Tax=Citrobacter freundii TaxID=546 RepID=UPI00155E415C|nr:hypothetical protein [Citrobacter freundii]NGF65994.1 hypothetical protein [Citrobacter freundii]
MTTNNHPAHGPVSLERLHQISEILSKAAAQSDGGNLGYAMADAVKVIDGVIATTNIEPVACIDRANLDYLADGCDGHVWATSYAEPGDVLLYTTPITPISPDKMTVEMAYPRVQTNWHDAKNFAEGWNACLAAMLQAGNHTEKHLDMVDHSGDANKMVAGNSPVIGIDLASGPDRTVEVRYVAPPGYVMVPNEPTEAMINAWLSEVANWRGHVAGYKAALAAAPQQENV